MYVVTFYSYKGGVGRSMALVNVAALLARGGKRVLLVDFDLEAPGLPSYGPLGDAIGLPGMVDYIDQYRQELKTPKVDQFIVECRFEDGSPVWIMPAGDNRSPSYTQRLGDIDWEELYSEERGFLMFEDLRQQWERHSVGFDYVLIDSRTGNTDVGGICTRQLPDAVVTMFVPTEQNIAGLAPIVKDIRAARRPNGRTIRLHFCASNVPDEYDENDVLEKRMASARQQLAFDDEAGIDPPCVTVHHRTSLDLLEMGLIVDDHPRSKLAKEYWDLRTTVIGGNLADRDGAVVALERLPEVYERARTKGNGQVFTSISERALEAYRLHSGNAEVALKAAPVFALLGDVEEEIASLDTVIAAGGATNYIRLRRAGVLLGVGRDQEALQDLRAVLASPSGTIFEYAPAAKLLANVSQDREAEAVSLLRRDDTRPRAKVVVARELLMADRSNMAIVAEELGRLLETAEMSDDLASDVRNAAELAFIAIGNYEVAQGLAAGRQRVPDLFNGAIASWGVTGHPPFELFRQLDARPRTGGEDANAHQCYAIIKGALGDVPAAMVELDLAVEGVKSTAWSFSCWTFLYGSGDQLLADLGEMRAELLAGRTPKPPFLDKERFSNPA